MYFIFSKVFAFLLYPILWVFILLLIAILTKNPKRKKHFLLYAVLSFYVFSNPFLLDEYAAMWDITANPTPNNGHYSCGIVLGGFSSVDKHKNGYFNAAADRFIQGTKLLAGGKIDYILITSGNSDLVPGAFHEADWVKTQLREFKFADSSILIEDKSRNTIENAVFSKKLLQGKHLQAPYLLITSAFHMRRALMIFKREGINVVAYPCNFKNGSISPSMGDLLPDADALSTWFIYFKEAIGYVVDYYKT